MNRSDAEMLIYGGPIHTMHGSERPEAMLIRSGKIARLGTLKDLKSEASKDARMMDLQGAMAMPGLIDTHPHLLHFAARADSFVDLGDAVDHDDIAARVAKRVSETPAGKWIYTTPVGEPFYFLRRSYRDLVERRLPDRRVLDKVAPNNPVFIQAWTPTTPNVCAFNSVALKLLDIGSHTPDRVCDVWIEKDDNGNPTGILRGTVNTMYSVDPFWSQVYSKIPNPMLNPIETTKRAMRHYNKLGVTTVYEAHNMTAGHIGVYQKLHAENELRVRVMAAMEVELFATQPYSPLTPDEFQGVLDLAKSIQFEGDEYFCVRGATISDGGPCWTGHSRSYEAYKDPYGRPTKGQRFMSDHKRRRFIDFCAEHNVRGNFCCGSYVDHDEFLELLEEAPSKQSIQQQRWILQHAATITTNQVKRFKSLGFDVTTSMSFPWGMGDVYGERIGNYVLKDLVPLNRLVANGLNVGCGSDWGPKNIFEQIRFAETHEFCGSGFRNNGPDQKVSRQVAVEMWTSRAATVLDWLDIGVLKENSLADVVVLDRDILSCSLDELPSTVVLETVLGGHTVYSAKAGHS